MLWSCHVNINRRNKIREYLKKTNVPPKHITINNIKIFKARAYSKNFFCEAISHHYEIGIDIEVEHNKETENLILKNRKIWTIIESAAKLTTHGIRVLLKNVICVFIEKKRKHEIWSVILDRNICREKILVSYRFIHLKLHFSLAMYEQDVLKIMQR